MHHRSSSFRRAFTAVELLVVVIVIGVLLMILIIQGSRSRITTRHPRDSANIRGIHQGLVLFAQGNRDRYPLPSELDKADVTIKLGAGVDPTEKDTTSNIISTLIYGTFFGPEICISDAESDGKITLDNGYEYTEPRGAVNPKRALWDPKFNADFTAVGPAGRPGGHFSYAHMLPSGVRLTQWRLTVDGTQAVLGNRGPLISSVAKGKAPDVTPSFDRRSLTLLIHGSRTEWEGNIAYNDSHVAYESQMATMGYLDASGTSWLDTLFFDEPDDVKGVNNFLGNFNAAGPVPAAFKAIWD